MNEPKKAEVVKRRGRKPTIKISRRIVNDHAWLNETLLAPYSGKIATVLSYKSGRVDLVFDNYLEFTRVEGYFTSEYNGWRYTIEKLLDRI